ncbi:MAG TPA: class D sortase [Bryobacteraceae bacterium]|nr:class D sortase [Bryobacteraceae bacterium]
MFRSVARVIQRSLFAVGFLVLGYVGADWIHSRIQQAKGNRELDRILSYKPDAKATPQMTTIPEGGLVGRVAVPKLHLSAVVFQGTNNSVLDRGVGHLDGSPLPGQGGNVVLAAHRDTFFRSLRDIHKGDDVTVTTESGPRTYKVDSTEIVDPTQTSVLNPTAKPTLTLITCYPFYYVGHAPKRFIVRALDETTTTTPVALKLTAKKETARPMPSAEPIPAEAPEPSHQSPDEIDNLTYVFRASQ